MNQFYLIFINKIAYGVEIPQKPDHYSWQNYREMELYSIGKRLPILNMTEDKHKAISLPTRFVGAMSLYLWPGKHALIDKTVTGIAWNGEQEADVIGYELTL